MIRLERLHLISRPDKLKPLRRFVRELAKKQSCSDESQECLVMAINEACMNVMQHAYDDERDKEIIIEFWIDKEELLIKIYDFADTVDIALIKSRDLEDVKPGGLGVHIINQVMDSVNYKHIPGEQGNVLEMRKNLNSSDACDISEQYTK